LVTHDTANKKTNTIEYIKSPKLALKKNYMFKTFMINNTMYHEKVILGHG